MTNNNKIFPIHQNIGILLFIVRFAQFILTETVGIDSQTSPSYSVGCYRSSGKNPTYLVLEKHDKKYEWPRVISVTISLKLIREDISRNVERLQKYVFYLQYGICSETINILTESHDTRSIYLYIRIFIGYFDHLFMEFSGTIYMSQQLGRIKVADQNDYGSMEINFSFGKAQALPYSHLPSAERFYNLFPKKINRKQRCIVIIDFCKSHILLIDKNVRNIPSFQSIIANVKDSDTLVDRRELAAYPSACPKEMSQNKLEHKLIAYVNSSSMNIKIEWNVIRKHYSPKTEIRKNKSPEVTFQALNIQIKSFHEDNASEPGGICAAYRFNAIYLFNTVRELIVCSHSNRLALTIKSADDNIQIETYTRELQRVQGNEFSRLVPQLSCDSC